MKNSNNIINGYDEYADAIAQSNADGLNRAHKYIEKPAMFSNLPDVKGKKVLCLGCGTGEECNYIATSGGEVTGIDLSRKSISIAQEKYTDITFEVMDMNKLAYESATFDVVYSSLTLHYSEKLDNTLKEIYRVLKPGGLLLFSVLHPIKWSAEIKRDINDERRKAFILGYDSFTHPSSVYGDYLHVRSIVQKPEGYPVIKYWNRPISNYFEVIKDTGFNLVRFIEPSPVEELKKVDMDYWNTQSKIPQFMIFCLQK